MSQNYEKFLGLLKKWPIQESKKTRDLGVHLRELTKNSGLNGNIFPGNSRENSKMLDSLLRLSANVYANQYAVTQKTGAAGITIDDLKVALSDKYIESYKKKIFKF